MPDNEFKLSVRQAETVARFLRGKGGRIAASVIRWKTPHDVAVMYLGTKAPKMQIAMLVSEIFKTINVKEPEGVKAVA